MNLRVKACAIGTLCSVLVAGCDEVGRDHPASQPQRGTQPEVVEVTAPSPEAPPPPTVPDTAPPATESDDPPPDTPEEAPPRDSEEVVENLDEALQEIAALERDTEYFAAVTRMRKLLEIYRDREEGQELRALHQRLHRDYRTASGLDFAVRKLGTNSNITVGVATHQLTVKAKTMPKSALMNLQSITLEFRE